MSKASSPYYPPRARWYAPLFHLTGPVRRTLALDRIHVLNIEWHGLALSCLVPGFGFYLRGPRLWGQLAMAACALLFLIFIVWLGHPVANLAFGLMLSTHCTGVCYYCGPTLNQWELRWRLLFTVCVLVLLGFFIYAPLRNGIQNHWLMPLRMNGQVIVVQKMHSANSVKRGDWVAYNLSYGSDYGDDLRITARSGVGLQPVLAVAGDNVTFSTNGFLVNGVLQPALPHMPTAGSLVVPEKQWFIWPSFNITGHGYNETQVSTMMMRMATVQQNQFIGRPLQHWFWRKQILP